MRQFADIAAGLAHEEAPQRTDVVDNPHPEIAGEIASGRFATLRAWLTDNIYRHGRTLTPEQIVARATGSPMTVAPYLAYLRSKYGVIA